jgi:hypothetical protein
MSNSLLRKVHFDLLTDVLINGPSDIQHADWPLVFPADTNASTVGQILVNANRLSQSWHLLWRTAFTELGGDPSSESDDALMHAASELAASRMDDPAFYEPLFAAEDLSWLHNYEYEPRTLRLTCAQALNLLECWEYNSGEHLSWQDPQGDPAMVSEAHHLVNDIRSAIIMGAPGVPSQSVFDVYTEETAPTA